MWKCSGQKEKKIKLNDKLLNKKLRKVVEWFYYNIKRMAMFKKSDELEGHSWKGVLFYRRDLNIFWLMCKILWDKIEDIHLIQYLLTF